VNLNFTRLPVSGIVVTEALSIVPGVKDSLGNDNPAVLAATE